MHYLLPFFFIGKHNTAPERLFRTHITSGDLQEGLLFLLREAKLLQQRGEDRLRAAGILVPLHTLSEIAFRESLDEITEELFRIILSLLDQLLYLGLFLGFLVFLPPGTCFPLIRFQGRTRDSCSGPNRSSPLGALGRHLFFQIGHLLLQSGNLAHPHDNHHSQHESNQCRN
ncbi:MAG: hypothetical protein CMO40_09230 [Verrucomicrobiaceae bacterium]|nr:hypothetical protein [Verrucomicrobiaceae bacterium]